MSDIDSHAKLALRKAKNFADAVNLAVGRKCIDPSDLYSLSEENITSDPSGHMHKTIPDVSKMYISRQNGTTCHTKIMIQLQYIIDYSMPKRSADDCQSSIGQECNTIQKHHTQIKDLQDDEFIARFSHDDKLTPTASITLYFGRKQWKDCPDSLLSISKPFNQNLSKIIYNPKANILNPLHIDDEKAKSLCDGDLWKLILVSKYFQIDKKKLIQLLKSPDFEQIDYSIAQLIMDLLGKKLSKKYYNEDKEGVINMEEEFSFLTDEEKAAERTAGRKEGFADGEASGETRGEAKTMNAILMIKQGFSNKEIEAKTNLSDHKIENMRKILAL